MYETRGDAKFYYSYDANGILYSVKYTLTDSSDLADHTGEHSSSITCGDPTCTQCRSDRRDYINNNIDRYNNVGMDRTIGISEGIYFLLGASYSLEYDYGYVIDQMKDIWG